MSQVNFKIGSNYFVSTLFECKIKQLDVNAMKLFPVVMLRYAIVSLIYDIKQFHL